MERLLSSEICIFVQQIFFRFRKFLIYQAQLSPLGLALSGFSTRPPPDPSPPPVASNRFSVFATVHAVPPLTAPRADHRPFSRIDPGSSTDHRPISRIDPGLRSLTDHRLPKQVDPGLLLADHRRIPPVDQGSRSQPLNLTLHPERVRGYWGSVGVGLPFGWSAHSNEYRLKSPTGTQVLV